MAMGYTNLYITSKNPDFVPSEGDIKLAQSYIDHWMDENEVFCDPEPKWRVSSDQMLVGTFPEKLTCGACGVVIDMHDEEIDEWAYELRESIYVSRDARNVIVRMPCCQATLTAGTLALESDKYPVESHLCRFSVYFHDFDCELKPTELAEFSQILKCEIIQFVEIGT